jgi:hypothetical protein
VLIFRKDAGMRLLQFLLNLSDLSFDGTKL